MLKLKSTIAMVSAGAAVLSLTSTANAAPITTPITINNPSFENPALAAPTTQPGTATNNNIPGWTGSSNVPSSQYGVFYPNTNALNAGVVPHGNQVAYLRVASTNGISVSQFTTVPIKADHVYVLKGFVGDRKDTAFASNYLVELLAGNNVLAINSGLTPANGTFLPFTIEHTVWSGQPVVGQNLGIRLTGQGPNQSQVLFDNLSLTETRVPTPAVLPGLIGMGIAAWRKRRGEAMAEMSEEA